MAGHEADLETQKIIDLNIAGRIVWVVESGSKRKAQNAKRKNDIDKS